MRRLISQQVTAELSEERARRLASHLQRCPGCRVAFEDEVALVEALRSEPELLPPSDLWGQVTERLEARAPAGVGSLYGQAVAATVACGLCLLGSARWAQREAPPVAEPSAASVPQESQVAMLSEVARPVFEPATASGWARDFAESEAAFLDAISELHAVVARSMVSWTHAEREVFAGEWSRSQTLLRGCRAAIEGRDRARDDAFVADEIFAQYRQQLRLLRRAIGEPSVAWGGP